MAPQGAQPGIGCTPGAAPRVKPLDRGANTHIWWGFRLVLAVLAHLSNTGANTPTSAHPICRSSYESSRHDTHTAETAHTHNRNTLTHWGPSHSGVSLAPRRGTCLRGSSSTKFSGRVDTETRKGGARGARISVRHCHTSSYHTRSRAHSGDSSAG